MELLQKLEEKAKELPFRERAGAFSVLAEIEEYFRNCQKPPETNKSEEIVTTVAIAAKKLGKTTRTIHAWLDCGILRRVQPRGKGCKLMVGIPANLIVEDKQ